MTPPFELDDAGDLREQGVVRAPPDVEPGLERRAPLADQDRPSGDELTGKPLHAQHLGIRVAPVARASDALLVCHRFAQTSMVVIRTVVTGCRCPTFRR